MKLSVVVMLVISVSAILSIGHEVPTLAPSSGNIEAITVTDGNQSTVSPISNINSTRLNPAHGQPGHRCDIGVGQPLDSKPATQTSTFNNPASIAMTPTTKPTKPFTVPVINPAGGLNPPHGQPGHRCDIKVGEPLNSKPAQTTATNPVQTSNTTPTTNITAVAPGMNPPHGQPGHRCDIKVGEPLNSKPAQTTATNPVQTTSTTSTTNTTPVAPGMNPRHGQPGHRCDILVGQPLNSKPAQTSLPTTPITPWNDLTIKKDSTKG